MKKDNVSFVSYVKKTFTSKIDTEKHLSCVHKENKSYSCEICGKEFTIKHGLNVHISIETFVRKSNIIRPNGNGW